MTDEKKENLHALTEKGDSDMEVGRVDTAHNKAYSLQNSKSLL